MNSLFSRKSDANTINELVQVSADAALHSISCLSVVSVVYVFSTDSPTNVGPSSWKEEDSDKLLWIILSAVLGVLLIVSIVVVIVCYRRLKKTRRDQGG